MKRVFLSLGLCGAMLGTIGCTKSVDRAEHDVQRTKNQAVHNIQEEQRELQDTKRDASERIARQERRVEDTARRENEKVIREERALQDAERAEARRESDNATVPPSTSNLRDEAVLRTNTDRPGRVDVNINRGPGGVNVDVNRNP